MYSYIFILQTLGELLRKLLPTLVFLPGELHGQRSLVGFSLWGHKDSDMPERLTHSLVCA